MPEARESSKRQREVPSSKAEYPLRLLILASLVLPVAIFAIGSWISYDTHFSEARDRLDRTLGMMHENASRVFDTFEVSERYLEEMFENVSDADIRSDEALYSSRLRNLIKNLPQLRDLAVIDAEGHPLVSGMIYPMPRTIDLSDRDYFTDMKAKGVDTFVSGVMESRALDTNFFAITRKRLTASGGFNGVYLVAIAPEYFTQFYAQLPKNTQDAAGLMRGDGEILARYPHVKTGSRLPPNSTLMTAIREEPGSGLVTGKAYFEPEQRIYAYSRLPNQDVYVFAGVDRQVILADWIRDMSAHLIFGIPATLAMFTLALLTLRNTRRTTTAYRRLREETARRQTTEMALRQAQKMEAVGRLTGGIAHDFNNLLTAILGNTELAMRRFNSADERLSRALTSVREASLRAATLVQRLLTFSRQHPQEIKTVDINRLVGEMSELLHRTIGETVKIETVLASGLWKSAIDPNQLENAILNLAVNARDAMADGGRLTIETSNAYLDEAYVARAGGGFKAGQYVMVALSDSGVGMSREVRDKAFEPFFTTKPPGAGSGLGLSMVYGFVQQSGGHIQIYSEAGQGTSIKMYFPRLTDESLFPAWDAVEAPSMPRRAQHEERILLVEDDKDVRQFVADALTEIGYSVEHAATAAEALEILSKRPDIALLFTDVVLPGGMNGRELANAAHAVRPGLPVLFATGYTRNAIIHHGRLDANVELLIKPFTTEALARKLRQVLDGKAE
jgi:two-component system NtrC family sensor kinase